MATPPAQTPALLPAGRRRRTETRIAVQFGLAVVLIVVVLELVDLYGLSSTRLGSTVGDFKAEAIGSMTLIADLKEERLRSVLDDYRKALSVFAGGPWQGTPMQSVLTTEQRLTAEGLQDASLWARLRGQMAYSVIGARLDKVKRAFPDFRRIFIAEAKTGRIIASTDDVDLGADVAGLPYFLRAPRGSGDYVGRVCLAGKGQEPVFHIARAMLAPDGGAMAVLVVEVKTDAVLTPLLRTGGGLGAHGEAILFDRDGRILTSLKDPVAGGGRPKPLEYRLQTEDAKLALQHRQGVVEAPDYRGVPVLAAYRFIQITPEVGWGLIVKRDRAELFVPLHREIYRATLLETAGVVVVMLIAAGVARRIHRPLRALAQAAEQVAGGDLTARAPVVSNDEVGALARTFNSMVQRIQDWQEALVRQERLTTLGQVTATVSHELRNPLGAIRISFFVIAERLRGKELGIGPALERIERSIARCENIISDLLDFSRDRPMQQQPTEIDPWLASLLDEYELPSHVVVCRELAAAATVPLDRERFRRCMINVLNNACQAMDSGGGRMTVASGVENGYVAIRVADTGCGIPADQLEKIFEPLYSTKSFGIGLGLPIIKQIINGHKGSVEVQSQAGQGTTFTVRLPLHPAPGKEDTHE